MDRATSSHKAGAVPGDFTGRGPARVFAGIAAFEAMAMFRRGLFYAYLSVYLRFFLGLSATETTLMATLPMLLNVLCQMFLWGRLSDRYQLRRTFIIRGECLAAVGTLLVWFLHIRIDAPRGAGYVIILGLAVVEIFWSMSNIGWSALISDLYPESRRSTVQGWLSSVGGLGRIAGVGIGGLLYDGLGFRFEGWGFSSGALFFVAAGVMFLSLIPMASLPEGGLGRETAGTGDGASDRASIRLFHIFLTAMVLINFGRNAAVILQSQYLFLEEGFAVTSRMLSHIVNTESAAVILMGLLAGRIGRRLGNGRAVCLGALAAMGYLLCYIFGRSLGTIFLGSFLKGTSNVVIMASAYAFASVLIPPERRARLFGYFNATFFLSWGISGTLVAGPVVDALLARGAEAVFAYRAAYVAAAGMTMMGLALQAVLVFRLVPRSAVGRDPGSGL